jgi:peptidylprolyl isomerase
MLKLALAGLAAAAALSTKPTPPLADIVAAAPASAWRDLDQADLLYLELPKGRVVIELAPAFAPKHVANIKALVRAGYFDQALVVRVQDNFVAQWGLPDGKPEPPLGAALAKIADPEFTRPSRGLAFRRVASRDAYAPEVGVAAGLPAARDPRTGRAWAAHCYGTVAIARDNAPDSGNGASLYAVIGRARRLDRNLTVAGRVVEGMDLLASLPRGQGAMGFYAEPASAMPIRLRLGSDLPAGQQVRLQALREDSGAFARAVAAYRDRHDAFYRTPPGGIDICDAPLPVRRAK